MSGQPIEYLSRGIDYLNDLGAKLRDLRGLATLTYELIQNADDASGASRMSFDIGKEALVVDNDGVFTDCGHQGSDCRWKQERGHRCDFHRFRTVGSGDKREEVDTAGAFGIGFTAVYQITDQPELISAGRHWILHEDQPEEKRIAVCAGCERCCTSDLPGTRFILPWATDPTTKLRQALRVEAVSVQDPDILIEELLRSLPTAMLFLRKLNTMEVKREGATIKRFERLTVDDGLIITDGTPKNDRIWYVLKGTFKGDEAELKKRHQGRIEAKRKSDVVLAVPRDIPQKGLLCATLPSQYETGLPFHINADFFTTSDRKHIIFGSDYQSQWNRAAIKAAAEALRDKVLRVRDKLGHKHLWEIIAASYQVAQEAKNERTEASFSNFWQSLQPELSKQAIVFTYGGQWCLPSKALLPEKEEERSVVELLDKMGISIVNEDLRSFFPLLRSIGVPLLDVSHIVQALVKHGLIKRTEMVRLPVYLRGRADLRLLWREIGLLLTRPRKPDEKRLAEEELSKCAIAPGRDNALWPCCQLPPSMIHPSPQTLTHPVE